MDKRSSGLVPSSTQKGTSTYLGAGLVVAGQSVDTRLDENEAELGVWERGEGSAEGAAWGEGRRTLVVTVALEVLADSDGLLDEVVEVLRDLGGESWRG